MQKTPNYQFDLYEENDVTSYLTTYNNTITAIDTAVHGVETQVTKNTTDVTSLEQQLANANDEINELTGEVSDLTTLTSGHTDQINGLSQRVQQSELNVTNLTNEVNAVKESVGTVYRGVLSANEETLAITIGEFTDDTLVDIYASVYGLQPLTMELRPASGGQPNLCVTTWTAQAEDIKVAVLLR